jgi:hypothetical protein
MIDEKKRAFYAVIEIGPVYAEDAIKAGIAIDRWAESEYGIDLYRFPYGFGPETKWTAVKLEERLDDEEG